MADLTSSALKETTPLLDEDTIYIIDRNKEGFYYPIHTHRELELNYLENVAGGQRIVGDSVETMGDYDLALIGDAELEHGWRDHECPCQGIREVTIQFPPELFSSELLSKKQFHSIRQLLEDAKRGVAFDISTVLKLRSVVNAITAETKSFYTVTTFFMLMYELSVSDYKVLSSSLYVSDGRYSTDPRIQKIEKFIVDNMQRPISVPEVAELVGVAPAAFSRFFKGRTGISFSDFLADMRIGFITRELIDSHKSIADICYESGYNNVSNFNRVFKSKKGYTPREFREIYRKRKAVL
ncbi:MAG: AraC family transcriptional regulator [Rikenellaceae bacterium]